MVTIAIIGPPGIPDRHRPLGVRDPHLSARQDPGSRQGPSERSPTQPAAGRHAASSTFLRHRYLYLPSHAPRTFLHAVTLRRAHDDKQAVTPNSSGNEGLATLEEPDPRAYSSPPTPRQTHHGSSLPTPRRRWARVEPWAATFGLGPQAYGRQGALLCETRAACPKTI
jgi:hypothetical protein